MYAGGVFQRYETLTVGEALIQALKAEGLAEGGGDVIVSDPCFKYVINDKNGIVVKDEIID